MLPHGDQGATTYKIPWHAQPTLLHEISQVAGVLRALKRTALIADGSALGSIARRPCRRPSGSAPPSTRCPPRNTHTHTHTHRQTNTQTHTQVVDDLPCSHRQVVACPPQSGCVAAPISVTRAHAPHEPPTCAFAWLRPCCLGPPPRTARSTCPAGPLSTSSAPIFSKYATICAPALCCAGGSRACRAGEGRGGEPSRQRAATARR